jgi:hypothetical protein
MSEEPSTKHQPDEKDESHRREEAERRARRKVCFFFDAIDLRFSSGN